MGHENNGACDPVVATVSWPGLARPPTTLPPPAPPVVDGRDKAGHDTKGAPAPYFNAHAVWAGPRNRLKVLIPHWRQASATIVAASCRMQACSFIRRGPGTGRRAAAWRPLPKQPGSESASNAGGCTDVQPPPSPWSNKMTFESLKKLAQDALETAKGVAGKASASAAEG